MRILQAQNQFLSGSPRFVLEVLGLLIICTVAMILSLTNELNTIIPILGTFQIPTFVLTSNQKSDDVIERESSSFAIEGVIRGSLKNVLSRYKKLYEFSKKKFLIRTTADNPFTDSLFIQNLSEITLINNFLYSRFKEEFLPVGYHSECFHYTLIDSKFNNTDLAKEHVTFEMRKKFNNLSIPSLKYQMTPEIRSEISCSIDNTHDYKKAQHLVSSLGQIDFKDLYLTQR
tara:strand:+ start:111 stop:800 length:690 start_codon:yes stop_codon:yes gene_type:complete